jgi:hypothetical protein
MNMHIFSTFESNIHLELAISTLEKKGIKKENIFGVPLDNRAEDRKFLIPFTAQTGHHS